MPVPPDSQKEPLARFGGFPKLGVPFGGPHNKDYSILGSILGSPYLGKLPNLADQLGRRREQLFAIPRLISASAVCAAKRQLFSLVLRREWGNGL